MRENFDVRAEYVGDGAQDEFTFDFKITSLSHLLVVVCDDDDVETFSVRGDDVTDLDGVVFDAVAGGGTVTLATALPASHKIAILLADDSPKQEMSFKNKSDFTLARIEAALDVLSGQIQRLAYLVKRTPKTAETVVDANVAAFDFSIPDPTGQAGKTLTVNAAGDGFEWI